MIQSPLPSVTNYDFNSTCLLSIDCNITTFTNACILNKSTQSLKATMSYLQMVMARMLSAPVKDGKKSSKMKTVIIWEARQALLEGWKFILRLI